MSFVDLELGFPSASLLMSLGWLARPVLAPLVLSTKPVPARTGAVLLTGLAGGTMLLLWRLVRNR
jgi:hypothetical protein